MQVFRAEVGICPETNGLHLWCTFLLLVPFAVMVQLFLGLDAVSGTFLLAAPLRTMHTYRRDRRDFDWQEALVCSAERTRRWLLATACAYWAIALVHG